VRPIYCGGIYQVLNAYKLAKNTVSINKLCSYLKKISYSYPYHQSVGFCMEVAGYREAQVSLLDQFPRDFDFYLDYNLKSAAYNSRWKLFVPKGL
jgi:hypothetical protein